MRGVARNLRTMPGRVGYVLGQFPKLSETFILNEVLELERQGVPLDIFSLAGPDEGPVHGYLKQLATTVTYLAEDGLSGGPVQEARYDHGMFQQRQLEETHRGRRVPEAARLSGVLGKLARQVCSFEELGLFRTQVGVLHHALPLASLVKLKGVSHLHAHFAGRATTVVMTVSQLTRLPFSFTPHAWDLYNERKLNRHELRAKIRAARFVVACTEYNRRVLLALGGQDTAHQIVRINYGISLARVRPDPAVHREPNLVLGVGRLVEKKGFHVLLRACRLLQDRAQPFRCVIVGAGEEDTRLRDEVRTLELGEQVTFLGAQPHETVVDLMQKATVFVLPCVVSSTGNQDGLPVVLIEALAVGLPAISTTVSGIPELIEDGKSGLLVPSGDTLALAAAIQRLLREPTLRTRLASGGLRKVRGAFDIRKTVKRLADQLTKPKVRY